MELKTMKSGSNTNVLTHWNSKRGPFNSEARENYIKKNDNSSPQGSAFLSCSLKTTCLTGRGTVRNADSSAPPQTSESESKGVGPRNLHLDKLQVIFKCTEIWASPYWKQKDGMGGYSFDGAKEDPLFLLPVVVQMGSAILLVIPLCWPQLTELETGACLHLTTETFSGIFKLQILIVVPLWKWNLQCEPESCWQLCRESQKVERCSKWSGYILSLAQAVSEAQLHFCNCIMWTD